ncbi:MAG: hypothetical protein WC365_05185 [Candidatus Babeliales bacterium]|jgi:hypothetical protein
MFKILFGVLPFIFSLQLCAMLPRDNKSSSDDETARPIIENVTHEEGILTLVMPENAELCDIFKRFGVSADFLALTQIHNELGGKEITLWGLEILKTHLILDYAEKLRDDNQDPRRVMLERLAVDAAINSLLLKIPEALAQDKIIRMKISKSMHTRKRAARPIFQKK